MAKASQLSGWRSHLQDDEWAKKADLQRDKNGIHVEKKLRLSEKERMYLSSEQLPSLWEAQLYRIL